MLFTKQIFFIKNADRNIESKMAVSFAHNSRVQMQKHSVPHRFLTTTLHLKVVALASLRHEADLYFLHCYLV